MSNRENQDRKSGVLSTLTMAAVAVAMSIAALLLMPVQAGHEATASAKIPAAAATRDEAGYLPAQYVNQAKEADPMPQMYY